MCCRLDRLDRVLDRIQTKSDGDLKVLLDIGEENLSLFSFATSIPVYIIDGTVERTSIIPQFADNLNDK